MFNKSKSGINNLAEKLLDFITKYHWQVIAGQLILLILIFWIKGLLVYKFFNDEPSYVLVNFSSLPAMLGGHRTIGLPLILKLYHFFFKDNFLWPYFQMVVYSISVIFLYGSFLKFGFCRVLSLVIATHLIWEPEVFKKFSYVMTEPLTVSFLNFALGFLLRTFRQNDWKSYFLLGFSTFALYQLRPNLTLFVALLPFWALAISCVFEKSNFLRIGKLFLKYAIVTVIPLLLFCLLRLAMVGHFGVVSFAGVGLSGHATYFLNEKNIKYLSGENRILAEEILQRKRKLGYPVNLAPSDARRMPYESRYSRQNGSHASTCMTSWLAAIKYKMDIEPFDDPMKRIEPWRHAQTLSGFFSIYNVEIDKLLMSYSTEIIKIEWKRYLSWIARGSYSGIKEYVKDIIKYRIRQIWILFLIVTLIARFLFFRTKNQEEFKNKRWFQEVMIISIFGLSLFLVNIIPIVMFSCIDVRYLYLFSLYLFPAITLLVLPPNEKYI